MRLIGVLDLRGGRAVHARGGHRDTYAPVTACADTPLPPGDPAALSHAYRDALGVRELYVADLDAILGGTPRDDAVAAIGAASLPLWLDAGVRDATGARAAMIAGAARVVVGLETLPDLGALRAIGDAVGGERVAFSLDLRDGRPLVMPGAPHAAWSPVRLAAVAADAGVGAVIVLDLARVGSGRGIDDALMGAVRAAAPGPLLLAGGGVRGPDDLARLADGGCDGALVASALLDGRLDRAAVAHAHALAPLGRS